MRIREIDVLRGFAIVLVILGHAFIVHPVDIHEVPWCASLHNWIYSFHMELFFLLCGAVYHCKSYIPYLKKKTERILIPYLFFGIISLVLHVLGLEAVNKSYTLGGGINKLLFYGGSYWFLYALFILFLIYPWVEKVCNKPWKEILFAIVCALVYEFVDVTNFLNLNRFFYYIPFFVTGRYAMLFIKSENAKIHWLNIFLFVVSLGVYIGLGASCKGEESYSLTFFCAISMGVALYVVAHYLVLLVDKGSLLLKWIERLLTNCSIYSLQLYLFNGFLLTAIRYVVCTRMHITSPIIIVTSIVVGNLLITLLICNYVLPHTRVLSWLCGTEKTNSKKK